MAYFCLPRQFWKCRMFQLRGGSSKQALATFRNRLILAVFVVAMVTILLTFSENFNAFRHPFVGVHTGARADFNVVFFNKTGNNKRVVVKTKFPKSNHVQAPRMFHKFREDHVPLPGKQKVASSMSFLQQKAGSLVDIETLNSSGVISYARIVVIVAYMRTGSTLVGKLIEQHPGTFYLFEPIRSVWEALYDARSAGAELKYLDGSKRNFTFADRRRVVLTELINWMTCRLDLQSEASLSDEFHGHFTTQMKRFYICSRPYFHRRRFVPKTFRSIRPLRLYSSYKSRLFSCLKTASLSCKDSPLIAIKLIRLRMRQVEPLLPLFPNMKVIHLNRDPRGMFNSRINLHIYRNESIKDAVKQQCLDISSDLSASKSILQEYPDRLKFVNYEDLAEDPLSTAEEIYKFIGIQFTENVMKFVKMMTSSRRDSCAFCTERSDSAKTANKWRSQMTNKTDFDTIRSIQALCRKSNRVIGYLPFDHSSQLTDAHVPSRKPTNVSKALLADDGF